MRRQSIRIGFLLAAVFAAIFPWSSARAQAPGDSGSLYEKLKGQYKPTKLGLDSTGIRVIDAGTVLVVHGKSLFGTPPGNMVTCAANFQDGNLHPPGGFCTGMVKDVGRYLDDGEKVYVTKIDINLKKEKVTLTVIECDSCNGVQQPSYFKSAVSFEFPKGYLEGADAGQVSDVIGQVFTIDAGNGGAQQQDAVPAAGAAPAPADAAPPAAAPAPIKIGQTIDEVQANTNNGLALVADLGEKKIYQYNGLKITFVKGKVSDVQ
jgi:hypothetical protein